MEPAGKTKRIRKTKKPSFIRTFMDPELVKEWERYAQDYPYLFWVQAMNVRTIEEWLIFTADKGPNLKHRAKAPQSAEEFVSIAKARRDAYFCIARGFAEPSKQLVKEILDGSFANVLRESLDTFITNLKLDEGLKLLLEFRKAFEGANLEKLHCDMGSEHLTVFYDGYFPWLSCYESVYRSEKQIMGELTMRVKCSYQDAGFTISKERGNDPPDDLKLEMEFMYRLCELELRAWRNGNKDEALKFLNMQNSFLREHLIEWVPFLCEDLVKREFKEGIGRKFHRTDGTAQKYAADTVEMDFYRSLGFMTSALLEHDYAQLEALLNAAQTLPEEEIFPFATGVEERDAGGETFSLVKK